MALIGLISYPGISQFEDFQMTDVTGIAPAIITVTYYPGLGRPADNGDFVLNYGSTTIRIRGCRFDAASVVKGTGGTVATARFFDERWAWRYRSISGRYNVRLPNNFVDPAHEKTPRELASLCFNSLVGPGNYDVSALPMDARPDINWDNENAAEALARLCDDFGCRIVPVRSTGKWMVVVTGAPGNRPTGLPYEDSLVTIDPKEVPDYIRIVTAPNLYQWGIPLEPVVKDVDLSWQTLPNVSYRVPNSILTTAYGLGEDVKTQAKISKRRMPQPDGTRISPNELALQTALRCFRVYQDPGNSTPNTILCPWSINGTNYVTRKQLILSDQLAQTYVDATGVQHSRPAFSFGEFWSSLCPTNSGNLPFPTRVDFQGQVYRDQPGDRASFSMSLDPVDTDRSILTYSKIMCLNGVRAFYQPVLYLVCAAQIRDPTTWQPVRTEFFKQIGTGADKGFCFTVVKDDLQPWFVANYTANANGFFIASLVDNSQEIQSQCQGYADAIAKTFQQLVSGSSTYIGWFPIDFDGEVMQITYSSGPAGCGMELSTNCEHDFDIPTCLEQRQRDGRRNIDQKIRLLKDIAARLGRERGTWNT